jgi:hypothetical protein
METQRLKALYDEANRLDYTTTYELESMDTQSKLVHLTEEYTVHVKIGQVTVYKKGEILTKIKKACKEANVSFEKFVNENCGISQKTAVNYMNVFYYCCSCPEIAEKIPPAILYQVCTDRFNDELRTYLFSSGILEKITNADFKKLLQKAKKDGVSAIEEEVESISRDKLIYNQINYSISISGSVLTSLQELKGKIERRGHQINNGLIEFKEQIKSDQPEAAEINLKLYQAVEAAIDTLTTAVSESQELLREYQIKISVNV